MRRNVQHDRFGSCVLAISLTAIGLIAFSLNPAPVHGEWPEVRTWTSGEFKIQAKFVSVANGTVTIEQPDGETLEIELTKLMRPTRNTSPPNSKRRRRTRSGRRPRARSRARHRPPRGQWRTTPNPRGGS